MFNVYDRLLDLVLNINNCSVEKARIPENRHHLALELHFRQWQKKTTKVILKRLIETAITFVKEILPSCLI